MLLQQLLEDSDANKEDVGNFADEDDQPVTIEPSWLSATIPNAETPAEKDSLLLNDRELVEQLMDITVVLRAPVKTKVLL